MHLQSIGESGRTFSKQKIAHTIAFQARVSKTNPDRQVDGSRIRSTIGCICAHAIKACDVCHDFALLQSNTPETVAVSWSPHNAAAQSMSLGP